MDHIQAMSGHWVKLLICSLALLRTQVYGLDPAVPITYVSGAKEKGAVCLDGSPAAYFHGQGVGEGANNWVLYVQGGAWCLNETHCINRAAGLAGSSMYTQYNTLQGILSPNKTENPEFYNWNRVFFWYCDGGSFAGDVEEVNPKTNLHFRGARVFNAIVEDLLIKGMKNANNVILSGQSAGGLAAMLHCDQFRAQVPGAKRLKCLSDGGFFIRGKDIPGATESTIEECYGDVVKLEGLEKFLPKSCTSKMDAKLCLYPENFVGDIKTPLFIMNGAFDSYQIPRKVNSDMGNCTGQPKSCTPAQIQLAQGFRTSLLKALPKADCRSKGMYIHSSIIHDRISYSSTWTGPFARKNIKNKTPAEAFADWYFERDCFQEIEQSDIPY